METLHPSVIYNSTVVAKAGLCATERNENSSLTPSNQQSLQGRYNGFLGMTQLRQTLREDALLLKVEVIWFMESVWAINGK